VIFNEDVVYDGKTEPSEISVAQLRDLVNTIMEPNSVPEPEDIVESQGFQIVIPTFEGDMDEYEPIEEEDPSSNQQEIEETLDEDLEHELTKAFENPENYYPTPGASPPAALMAATISQPEHEEHQLCDPSPKFEPWKASFYAGTQVQPSKTMAQRLPKRGRRVRTIPQEKSVNKAKIRRLLAQPDGLKRIHRRELPPEPKTHEDLDTHLLGDEFRKAEQDHLQSHVPMNSWTEISKFDPEVKGHQVLDCMWVYVYKFDKHGRLAKCKARLVVRGDQQDKSKIGDTSLAARSFRVFMAIAARFDLELIQYDAVNAFVHAKLDEKVFMKMPRGYSKRGVILKLNRALYGLRKSPILWQSCLYSSLLDIGFKSVPHEPCCLTLDGILIFDIVVAYRKPAEPTVHRLINKLRQHYNLEGGNDLQWFLGIRILRDREKRIIWFKSILLRRQNHKPGEVHST